MRKGLIVAAALAALLALPAVVGADGLPMKGDFTGDGHANGIDALAIMQYVVDPTGVQGILQFTPTATNIACGDVNGDGFTNGIDALAIMQWVVDPTGSQGIMTVDWPALWEGSTEYAPPAL